MTSVGLSLALVVTFIHLAISNVEILLLTTMDGRWKKKKLLVSIKQKKLQSNIQPLAQQQFFIREVFSCERHRI